MLFNSLEFIIFFSLVVPLYFLIPQRHTWILLLAASYLFYMFWKPAYILLILLSTVVDYIAALLMSRHAERKPRRKYLVMSLVTNLGLLFLFKYFDFFQFTFARSVSLLGMDFTPMHLNLLLPVGISFYTFQTLSYTIDVYRGTTPVERHFGIFALYVSFFPQLVAGPIERSGHLLPQFRQPHRFDAIRVREGLLLMLGGFVKKVVIADRLATFVDAAYRDPGGAGGAVMITATLFFAFQIYCDFSGYSDIAIGAAKVLGFDLMKNFDRPYFSKSIREFWQRWHISLSTWFKDYVYIPLGGSRVSLPRTLVNLMLTFTISGLWHGASLTFVVWGVLHGTFMALERFLGPSLSRLFANLGLSQRAPLRKFLGFAYTFTVVNIGWVFFRAGSLSNALAVLRTFAHPGPVWASFGTFTDIFYQMGLNPVQLHFAILCLVALFTAEWIQRKSPLIPMITRRPGAVRWAVYYSLLLLILIFGVYGTYDQTQFIYFTF